MRVLSTQSLLQFENKVEESLRVSVPNIQSVEEISSIAHCSNDVNIIQAVRTKHRLAQTGEPPTSLPLVSAVND